MTGKRHAILVAASDFPEDDSLPNLRCPLQDVEALGEVLGADNHGGFDHVYILKNEPHYEILKKVNRVIKAADREDMVVFFYSGHGKLDEAGRLYLATVNTSVDVLEATSVPVSQIKDYFDVSAANQLAIVLDCCYSGAIEKSFTKGTVDEQLNLMSGGKGTYVLTASTGLQTAKENEGDDLSVFTKHLVNGILSGDADTDHNGVITLNELYKYTFKEVQKDSHQKPMKWDLNVEGELIIARSGKSHWKKRRDVVQEKLLAMGAARTLPNSILTAALSLSEKGPGEIKSQEKAHYALLVRLADEDMRSGGFAEAWLVAEQMPEPEQAAKPTVVPAPPEATIVTAENQLAPVILATVKKDWMKENLICGAVAIGGLFILGLFINAADDGSGDIEAILGATFLGAIAAVTGLVFSYRKRKAQLPFTAKFQYWGWGVLYVMMFVSLIAELSSM
ncbi:MAG: caspase family protein [Sneathiella sp.]|nr:caspase family protein [Sneathiella sp.]